MSLTDEELREEKTEQYINDYGYVVVNSNSAKGIESAGIFVNLNKNNDAALPIEEATAMRDGLTVVIDQYHDFIARRDAKTNQEIIDEMEPGTVFRIDPTDNLFRFGVKTIGERIIVNGRYGTFSSSEFEDGTITVVDL